MSTGTDYTEIVNPTIIPPRRSLGEYANFIDQVWTILSFSVSSLDCSVTIVSNTFLTRIFKLATGRWFSPGIPVSYTNISDRHDIIKILLKVALNTITTIPFNRDYLTFCHYAWPYILFS